MAVVIGGVVLFVLIVVGVGGFFLVHALRGTPTTGNTPVLSQQRKLVRIGNNSHNKGSGAVLA